MAAEKLGPAKCPLCGGTAQVSLSKSQLPVMVMNCCQAQLFTRSDKSDMLVRGLLLTRAPSPEPARVATDPAPEPSPPSPPPPPPASDDGFFL